MTAPRGPTPSSHVWAVTLVTLAVLASIVGLELAGAPTTNLLTYVGAGVTPTVTILLIGGQLNSKADDLKREVNGRFSEALSKIPSADVRRQLADEREQSRAAE